MKCSNRECKKADNSDSGCSTMRKTANLGKYCYEYIQDVEEELTAELETCKRELKDRGNKMKDKEIPYELEMAMKTSENWIVWGKCGGDKDNIDFDEYVSKAIECGIDGTNERMASANMADTASSVGLDVTIPRDRDIMQGTIAALSLLMGVFNLNTDGVEIFAKAYAGIMKSLPVE